MNFIENPQARHINLHSHNNLDSLNICRPIKKRNIKHKIKYPHFAVYTRKELKACILMDERPIKGKLTRKEYKKHLEQKERIKNFIEQELENKQNEELCL